MYANYKELQDAVLENQKSTELYKRLNHKVEVGKSKRDQLLNSVMTLVISDKLVPPSAMHFTDKKAKVGIYFGSKSNEEYTLHSHAFSQMCAKVGIPMEFANRLNNGTQDEWKVACLAEVLNAHYGNMSFVDKRNTKEPMKFLHRSVGTEVRGFLSRRFNRQLRSDRLLHAFVKACDRMGAWTIDANASDVKFSIKCAIPIVYEPVPGQFVCFGTEWANSDFGAGRMQVALTVYTPGQDRCAVLEHTLSKVHIGSVLEDSDLEVSDETANKEAETQASVINDAVTAQLSVDSVERLCGAIKTAHAEEVPWHRLKGQLAKFLNKKELETIKDLLDDNDVVDLPPIRKLENETLPSKWWASSAVGWLARHADDSQRKSELEHAAGAMLDPFMKRS